MTSSDSDPAEDPGLRRVRVERRAPASAEGTVVESSVADDWAVVEEPLEIRLQGRPLAVTMRTPGHDRELSYGFLRAEGIVEHAGEVMRCERPGPEDPQRADRLLIELVPDAVERWAERAVEREFRATSACGVCGKPSLEDLDQRLPEIQPIGWDCALAHHLPGRMRPRQALFGRTGGLHAAALFTAQGELLDLYEDIGRHNAVDKVVGARMLAGEESLAGRLLVVSGRAGFEIVQKAAMAACPVLLAVGAASSLAVELAAEAGVELWSFVGPERANRHLPPPPAGVL
ncbi:MAG TPA: formate dehydrogenase accessory sulfurtransferase FdhD [Thermoanaerobaculia bacterium]|nr:formate dehydrogenase accessory sulfurtransferase FdhD [Thermoanaerobaculia bacterium]